jgi:nitroreductase
VIRECLEVAVQAPTGGNSQSWHFVVVTDQEQRKALGQIYSKGYAFYRQKTASAHPLYENRKLLPEHVAALKKVRNSSEFLADHMHEVPVLLVPCILSRVDNQPTVDQAGVWGSILPAVWSFMLAARLHGLGSAWTTVHLYYEQEQLRCLVFPMIK